MQKYKYRNASLFIAIILIIRWLIQQFRDIITTRAILKDVTQLSFLKTYFHGFDTFSPIGFCTFDALLFMFMFVYIQRYVRSTEIIRIQKREKILFEHTKDILIISLIYTFVSYIIHFCGVLILFDSQYIRESHMILYGLINLPVICLFLIKTGLLQYLFSSFIGRKVSAFVVFAIYILEALFFAPKFKWLPFMDSSIYPKLLAEEISKSQVINTYVRLIAFIVALYVINLIVNSRKDYLKDEK